MDPAPSPKHELEYGKLRRTLSRRRLTGFVQKHGVCGWAIWEFTLVDPDLPDCVPDGVSSSGEHVRLQIEETLAVLDLSQRPRLRWVE